VRVQPPTVEHRVSLGAGEAFIVPGSQRTLEWNRQQIAHETEAKNRCNYAGAPPGRRGLRPDPHRAGPERATNH
jgi:hypothetical protein